MPRKPSLPPAQDQASAEDPAADQFRLLVEGFADPLLLLDSDYLIRYANRAFLRLFGYQPAEVIGQPYTLLSPKHDLAVMAAHLAGLQPGVDEPVAIECRLIRRDGTPEITEITLNRLTDAQGKQLIVLHLHLVTEQKQAEEKLRISQARYRSLVETQADLVSRNDPAGTITFVNDAFCRVLGLSREALLGRQFQEFIHPDDLPGMRAAGEGIRLAPYRKYLECRLLTPGGARWFGWESSAILDENGLVIEYQGVGRDITDRKEIDTALRASEERYRSLLASLESMVAGVDETGRFLYLNEMAARQFGAPAATLVGKTMAELLPEPVATRQMEDIRKVIHEDRAMTFEAASLVQGHLRWYRTTIQPVHDHTGKVVYVLINSTDIHNLKMAEAALRQQLDGERVAAEILQRLVNVEFENHTETIQSALASLGEQVGVDRCFIFVYHPGADEFANTYEWRAAGIDPSGSAGRRFRTQDHPLLLQPILRGEMINVPRVSDLPDTDPGVEIIKAQGVSSILHLPLTSEKGILGLIGFDVIGREHSWQEAEIHLLSIVGRIIANGLEQLQHEQEILALNQSLEQRVSERTEAVRQSQASLQAVLDTASDLIQSLDETGHYVYVNQAWCKTLGYSAEEARQMSMWQVLDPAYHPHCERTFRELIATGAPKTLDVVFRSRQGQAVLVEGRVTVRQELNGQRLTNGFFRDVTQRKLAENALRESEAQLRISRDKLSAANAALEKAARMKDEFLASMSHELRTPLTGILGLTEVLQMNVYGPLTEKQGKALKNIEESGRHLLALINDILDLSKIEAGMLELNIEPVALVQICQASLQLTKGLAHKKQQLVDFSITPSDIHVRGDARRLKQMLVNLLSNAIKFTPEKGSLGLDVRADQSEQTVRLAVWDRGIGIDPENLKKLFQPFVQLESSLARQYEGTGLGLSLVQRMAELHGGSVEVESAPGEGSRFTILLPWPPDATLSSLPSNPEAELLNKALIVEDREIDAGQLARYLRILGMEATIHTTGQGTVDLAAQTKPDVILLDLGLPDQYGLDVLAELKANPNTRNFPVIICSVEEKRSQAVSLGAAGYLVKPATITDLRNELDRIARELAQHTVTPPAPGSTRPTILIVDDNEMIIATLNDFLETQNLRVVAARGGVEMLEVVSDLHPDIILMDIQMPVMDGLEATRRLRSHSDPLVARVPIIALTGLAMAGDRERCLAAGANDYMSKPVGLQQLADKIRELLKH